MGREEDLETPAGRMAALAARVVRDMADKPGVWDFLEEFQPLAALHELEARAAENKLAQTAAAAEEGKRLFLFARGVELANAIQAAKAAAYERQQRRRP